MKLTDADRQSLTTLLRRANYEDADTMLTVIEDDLDRIAAEVWVEGLEAGRDSAWYAEGHENVVCPYDSKVY